MTVFRVGIIGTGKRKVHPQATGYGMAFEHAKGYLSHPDCEIVACADIVKENAEDFAREFEISSTYVDYNEMLRNEELDVVSVCTWPHLHEQMVMDCARARVKVVHCEKPMAHTWKASKNMVQECQKYNVQLTFNHQRRFGSPFRLAKEILKSGDIGDLVRLEGKCGDLYDFGTHYVDMLGFYNDEKPADWVLGQTDCSEKRVMFGMPIENSGCYLWKYKNDVYAFMCTGKVSKAVGCCNRIIGTEGVIEVGSKEGPYLRVKGQNDTSWKIIDTKGEDLNGPGYVERAIFDVVNSFTDNREPELSACRALNATEIIFACYYSSFKRMVVNLPLDIDGNPIYDILERI